MALAITADITQLWNLVDRPLYLPESLCWHLTILLATLLYRFLVPSSSDPPFSYSPCERSSEGGSRQSLLHHCSRTSRVLAV